MSESPNAASVALLRYGQVLLIQRARQPYSRLWTLPGGRLEPGETAEAAAIREVREELGLTARALRPVMQLTPGGDRRFRLQVFAAEAFEGEIVASDEIADYRWAGPEGLAGLAVTPHLPDVIEQALRIFDRT